MLEKLITALAINPPNLPSLPNLPGLPNFPGLPNLPNLPIPLGNVVQQPVMSVIDKLIGGQALTGSKTIIGVLSYIVVNILQATGVLGQASGALAPVASLVGVATPAGQILTVLSIAFTVLGALAKIDRATQAISAAVKN